MKKLFLAVFLMLFIATSFSAKPFNPVLKLEKKEIVEKTEICQIKEISSVYFIHEKVQKLIVFNEINRFGNYFPSFAPVSEKFDKIYYTKIIIKNKWCKNNNFKKKITWISI